jgi:hypothetical protein
MDVHDDEDAAWLERSRRLGEANRRVDPVQGGGGHDHVERIGR